MDYLEIILDALLDAFKIIPFLFLAYLLIEFLEKKANGKLAKLLSKSGKSGVVIGSLLGCIPQCGFSVAAANLYSGRIITLGTLLAVFISTSDEAIIIMAASPEHATSIFKLIACKVIIAIIAGMLIDLFIRKQSNEHKCNEHIHHICKHCGCDQGNKILFPAIKHTLSIFVFILLCNLIIGFSMELIGEDVIKNFMQSKSILQPIIAALIGLIPNCASSVILTQLHIDGILSFGSVLAGLISGAGTGLMILFKTNKNIKENFKIVTILYLIAVFSGIIIQFIFN